MINSIDTYRAAGAKAGFASKQGDVALVKHWREWVRKALMLEAYADRPRISAAYREAYRAEATPTVKHFR